MRDILFGLARSDGACRGQFKVRLPVTTAIMLRKLSPTRLFAMHAALVQKHPAYHQ